MSSAILGVICILVGSAMVTYGTYKIVKHYRSRDKVPRDYLPERHPKAMVYIAIAALAISGFILTFFINSTLPPNGHP